MAVNIAMCGYYAKNNFGDDFMAYFLSKVLTKNKNIKVSVYSDDTSKKVINGLDNPSYLDKDVIIIGGGGIVDPNFWAFSNNRIEQIIKSRKPVYFLNVNVYPEGVSNSIFVNQLQQLNATWWVRDTYTQNLLLKNNIQSTFLPDITFRENIITPGDVNTDNKIVTVILNHNTLMPCFQDTNVHTWLEANNNMRIIAHHLDWLTNFGWTISIIPAQVATFIDDRIPAALIYGY